MYILHIACILAFAAPVLAADPVKPAVKKLYGLRTPSGWMLDIHDDGSGRLGFGASLGDKVPPVAILALNHQRVRYGVLGATLSRRVGNLNARPENYGSATVTMLNAFFGGMCPAASWVVNDSGFLEGYGDPPNALYDPAWSPNAPLHDDVDELLQWLDANSQGWDTNLQSIYP